MKKILWKKWREIFDDDNEDKHKNIVIPTPIGLISHKIGSKSNGQVKFWVGHCNFDIDDLHYNVVINTPGVEILDVFTPYRFRICIGEAFDSWSVMNDISRRLGCKVKTSMALDQDSKDAILKEKNRVSKNKYWAVYILPNGKFESIGTNIIKEFTSTYTFYEDVKQVVGGKLLSCAQDKLV